MAGEGVRPFLTDAVDRTIVDPLGKEMAVGGWIGRREAEIAVSRHSLRSSSLQVHPFLLLSQVRNVRHLSL